jgi:hypothetical protein
MRPNGCQGTRAKTKITPQPSQDLCSRCPLYVKGGKTAPIVQVVQSEKIKGVFTGGQIAFGRAILQVEIAKGVEEAARALDVQSQSHYSPARRITAKEAVP